MTLLKDVLKIRTGGREVAKVKYGGKEIWPNDTFRLVFSQQEVSFTAAGGTAVIEVYGVTIRSGVEIERRRLDADEISAVVAGGARWAQVVDNSLTIRIANAGVIASGVLEDACTVSWIEHAGVEADIPLTRGANIKENVGGQYSEAECFIPDPVIWSGSGTDTALSAGDTVSLQTRVDIVTKQDYQWTSGYSGTDVVDIDTDYGHATMEVRGTGLSVYEQGSMANRRFVVGYEYNSGAARTGQLIMTYNYDRVFKVWRFNVKQAAR